MKNKSHKIILLKLLLPFILILLLSDQLNAQKHKVNVSKNWAVELALNSGYDNNALRYSEKYLDRFKNNEDEGRFHIKKYDDLLIDYTARISYSGRVFKNLLSVIAARVDYNQYTYNSVKTWIALDFTFQQYISQKTSLMFSYTYLPDFYISHFRDNDWTKIYGYTPITFKPFSYAKNDFSFWMQHNFTSSTRARVYLSLMQYYYNQHFTEYDSDNYLVGARIFNDISTKVSIDAGYKFVRSNAKGYDEPGETRLNSDDADATYNEHNIILGASYVLPKIFKMNNKISLSIDLYRRIYVTKKTIEDDLLHSGRKDFTYRLGAKYDFDLYSNLNTGIYVNYGSRDAEGSNSLNTEFISDEKDYNQFQIGLNLIYKFKF
jgi:hypothetical protein